jgi:large-conductance mechanosensitive channel
MINIIDLAIYLIIGTLLYTLIKTIFEDLTKYK